MQPRINCGKVFDRIFCFLINFVVCYFQGTGINRGGLYINQTQFYHAGTYTCVVKSTSQQISFSARLTVMGEL